MTRRLISLLILLVVCTLAGAAMMLVYYVTDAECHARGGHTEVIYGGRGGGWTCSGATR